MIGTLGCRAPPPAWAASAGPEDHNSEVKLYQYDTAKKKVWPEIYHFSA